MAQSWPIAWAEKYLQNSTFARIFVRRPQEQNGSLGRLQPSVAGPRAMVMTRALKTREVAALLASAVEQADRTESTASR